MDMVTMAGSLCGALLVVIFRKRSQSVVIAATFTLFFILFAVLGFFLYSEWSDRSHRFESLEDLSGAMLSVLWISLFYLSSEWIQGEKLKKSEERLKLAIQGGNLGMWDLDFGSGRLSVNDEMLDMIGFRQNQIRPYFSEWEKRVHPDDHREMLRKFNAHVDGMTPSYEAEYRIMHKDESWRWVSAKGRIVDKDEHGKPLRAVGVLIDITEKKLMEDTLRVSNDEYIAINEELTESLERIQNINRELEQARHKAEENDRLKTAFLANISHEIRTPMNGILGFISLLQNSDLKNDKRNEYLQFIETGGKRLLSIINDLVDISRIEEGQIELNRERISLDGIMEYLHQQYLPRAAARKLGLEFRRDETIDPPGLMADRSKLTQVISNLIDNAIKFTHQGEVVFGYRREGELLSIYVKDTGIGIEPELQEVIFDRFRQADISYSRGYEGSGLGLAISKAYVELHGSRLYVDSTPGQGSEFRFSLNPEFVIHSL